MKKLTIPIWSIALFVIAVSYFVWGVYQYSLYRQGDYIMDAVEVTDGNTPEDGTLVIVSGKPEMKEHPTDSYTGVWADCLVLVRDVDMYQYYVENDDAYTGYCRDSMGDVKGINGEEYNNPAFPAGLDNAVFFGKAAIEGTNVEIGPGILNEITYEDGHDLSGSLYAFKNDLGIVPDGDGGYTSCTTEKPEIGDIRIDYTAYTPDDFGEITLVGTLKDGGLGISGDGYDVSVFFGNMTKEQVIEEQFGEAKSTSLGLLVLGALHLIAAAVLFAVKNRKRNKKHKRRGKTAALALVFVLAAIMSVPGSADFGDFGGDSDYGDYGGYDSYDYGGYDSHDYGGYNNYNYGGHHYNDRDDDYTYETTTSYYTTAQGSTRDYGYYGPDGGVLSFDTPGEIGPDYSENRNTVFTAIIVGAFIVAFYTLFKSRTKRAGRKAYGSGTQNKSAAPGAQKTDKSTLRSISEYTGVDPGFSETEFSEKLSNLYVRLQNSWQKKDLEDLRPYLSDAFYSQSDIQLDRYRRNRQTNIIEKIAVLGVSISGWKQENGRDIIIAVVNSRIVDYVIDDESGEVVSGNPNAEKFMTYEWRLERTTGVTTAGSTGTTVQVCPQCGAAVNINHSSVCEYCGSVLTTDRFDWVLTSIKGIAQRTK